MTEPPKYLQPPPDETIRELREVAAALRDYADLTRDGIPFSLGVPTFEGWASVIEAALLTGASLSGCQDILTGASGSQPPKGGDANAQLHMRDSPSMSSSPAADKAAEGGAFVTTPTAEPRTEERELRYCAACQQPFTGLDRCPMCQSPAVRGGA